MTEPSTTLVQIVLKDQGKVNIQRCFYQVFKANEVYAQPRAGKGDCRECTFNPTENKQCTGYQGVMVQYTLR